MSANSPWSSPYSDWYGRSSDLPSSTPISRSDLLFAVTYSAMGGSGFTLALLKPHIAVTSGGQMRKVQADDFAAFSRLAEEILALPNPESSRGRGTEVREFRVHHRITCRPFTILSILKASETDEPLLDKTSVYGFSKATKGLEDGGNLPDVLWELLGLVSEVPSCVDGKVNEDVLKRVKTIATELGANE